MFESFRVLILIVSSLRAHLVLHLENLLFVADAPTYVLYHTSVRTNIGEQFPSRIANDPLLVGILLQILQVLLIHDMVHHVATPVIAWDVDLAGVVVSLESLRRPVLALLVHQLVAGATV